MIRPDHRFVRKANCAYIVCFSNELRPTLSAMEPAYDGASTPGPAGGNDAAGDSLVM